MSNDQRQWSIEPLWSGQSGPGAKPAAYGVYRRGKHGWYRVAERETETLAWLEMKRRQEQRTDVQISITT